jgi:lysophospholipase L1-like esterase
MAKRCSPRTGCNRPRANWWRQALGVDWFNHSNGGEDPFDPSPYLDLINLQSTDVSKFTLVTGNRISSWAEESGTLWSQSTDANRPTLTGGTPIFDGSNDQLIRASEVSATTYSLYVVFRDLGAITKILFGAQSASDYCMHDSPSGLYDRIQLATGGVTRQGWTAGLTGNRYSILNIRRNGNTLSAKINDRTLLARTTNFAGQATPIARLCSIQSAGFFMNAGVKAFCMSSQNLDDTTNQNIIDWLYSTYGLASDTAAECVTCFGDSNTVGQGVSSYALSLASQLGVADHNLGISGSRLTALDANSGIARWQSQIPTRPYTDYVVIQYGTNDILASVSAATFSAALNTVVSGLITAGYSPSKICLCSNPYQQSGQNATALNNYRTEIEAIRTTYGTKYFDLLQWGRDNGGDTLLTDAVHLNATYQTGWANGVFAAFTS